MIEGSVILPDDEAVGLKSPGQFVLPELLEQLRLGLQHHRQPASEHPEGSDPRIPIGCRHESGYYGAKSNLKL
jgi:hypothetical protein